MPDAESYLLARSMPVPECGCWIFLGYLNADGYGQVGKTLPSRLAHRLSYETFKGEIPAGLGVLHSCDTPSCINPDHLSVGDLGDNMRDMVARGRQCKGTKNAQAKLTEAEVLAIRASPINGKALARTMGISTMLVSLIRRRKIWRHI